MRDRIFLFSSDGYRECLDLDRYALTIDGLKFIADQFNKEFGNTIDMDSFQFNEKEKTFSFTYRNVDGIECQGTHHYITIDEVDVSASKIVEKEEFQFSQKLQYKAMDGNVYPAVCLGRYKYPEEGDYSIAIQYLDRIVITYCWADRLSDADKNNKSVQELLNEHGILITCFSIKQADRIAYRFYFTDVNSRYIHNPLIDIGNGKRSYPIYHDYNEGLGDMVAAANEYIKKEKS